MGNMRNQVPERKSVGVGAGQYQHGHPCFGFVADQSIGCGVAFAVIDSEWCKRRCACGEAVRLPDERSEELCEARSQEAARRVSVLVCGLSDGFERLGIEEERHDAHEGDAVAVGPGLFVWIAGHNDLPEVVADVTERESLLFALFVVGDVPCGLDVKAHVAFVDDEIHFVAPAAKPSGSPTSEAE